MKSSQSHTAHKADLILDYSARRHQSSAEAAGQWTWDQFVTWCACLPPILCRHEIVLLCDREVVNYV